MDFNEKALDFLPNEGMSSGGLRAGHFSCISEIPGGGALALNAPLYSCPTPFADSGKRFLWG